MFSDITIYKTAVLNFNTFLVDYVDALFDFYKLPALKQKAIFSTAMLQSSFLAALNESLSSVSPAKLKMTKSIRFYHKDEISKNILHH